MNPTPKELAAMVEAMTPGPWDFHDPQIIAPVRQTKKVTSSVAVVTAGLRSNAEMDSNGAGIVALRNHFASLMERYGRMQAALAEARSMLDTAMRNDLPGYPQSQRTRMIEANPGIKAIDNALADADKPLECRS